MKLLTLCVLLCASRSVWAQDATASAPAAAEVAPTNTPEVAPEPVAAPYQDTSDLDAPAGFIDAPEESAPATAASAQAEAPASDDADEATPTGVVSEQPWYQRLGIGGFVDVGFGLLLPEQTNTFFVGEVELDVEKKLLDVAALRFDLNVQNRLPWQPLGAQPGLSFLSFGFTFDSLVEQAYADYFPLGENGPRLRLGKYNANLTLERLDPTERATVSQSLAFLHATPGNFTGLALDIPLPLSLNLTLHAAFNGWDRGIAVSRNKTVGGKLSFDHTLTAGVRLFASFAFTYGTERFANERDYRLGLFGALQADFGKRFTLAAEGTYGQEPGLGRGVLPGLGASNGMVGLSAWTGIAAWARLVVPKANWLSATVRYDFFNDPARTRGLVQNTQDSLEGGQSRRQQLTASVMAEITAGARARIEYTADFLESREPDKVRALATAHRLVLQAVYAF